MRQLRFLTLFPEMVLGALRHSMLLRAETSGLVQFSAINPRDFSTDKHRTVDDSPYGGGPGMVMKIEPVARAIESLELPEDAAVVYTDPTGEPFRQRDAANLSAMPDILFLCGHYEGMDDRIRQRFATHVFSIGDFVLTGGELPALAMADAIVRLIPGVLGDPGSLEEDAHNDGLLSYPQFTRPEDFEGMGVPDVLLAGDHAAVRRWRRGQALKTTRSRRPDLFARSHLEAKDLDLLAGD